MTFEAKYRGQCAECEGVIEPGDRITRNPEGGYAHATCPELTLLDLRPGESVCGSCFTVHAGECA